MDGIGTTTPQLNGSHWLAPRPVTRAAVPGDAPGLVRRSADEGNGLRVHTIYFLAVSVVALAVIIVGIAVAAPSMM